MLNFLSHTVEYRQWGPNAATLGAMAVAALTFIELYALAVQGKSVWRQRSGQSLNVFLVAYAAFLSLAAAMYGFEVKSITLVWNGGSAGILGAWVLGGLYKFKPFSGIERILVPVFVLMPIAMFLPQRQFLYAILPIGFAISGGMQLRELLATKDRGVVRLWFLGAYLIGAICWITFGIAIGDWAVWAPQIVLGSIFFATIVAWYAARQNNQGSLSRQ